MRSDLVSRRVVGRLENDIPPGAMNLGLAVGDIKGDGTEAALVVPRHGTMAWFEPAHNQEEWKRHDVAEVQSLEAGGTLYDVTGDGKADAIIGGDGNSDELAWWRNPGEEGGEWTKHVIARTGHTQIHDVRCGVIGGRRCVVFSNQRAKNGATLWIVPIPTDPTVSPWPELTPIATGLHTTNLRNPHRRDGVQPEEGLAIADIDGDGENEVVFGMSWYDFDGHIWRRHVYGDDHMTLRLAVGDLDGDGTAEIVVAEGDPLIYGVPEGGKASWFERTADVTGRWSMHPLCEGLLDGHSVLLTDLTGSGRLDLVIGEIGEKGATRDEYAGRPPKLRAWINDGRGKFSEVILDQGTGTHESQVIRLPNGHRGILGKPLHGPDRWNLILWEILLEEQPAE